MRGLKIRKLADKTTGERVVRYDPETGEKKLVNPATPGDDHEPWPLAGVVLEVAPEVTTVSTTLVNQGRVEGWVSVEGERVVHRPGGPPVNVWAVTHTFVHADVIVFRDELVGDVRYRVVHQPDKYADYGEATYPDRVDAFVADDDTPVTDETYAAGATRVDHFYVIELEG